MLVFTINPTYRSSIVSRLKRLPDDRKESESTYRWLLSILQTPSDTPPPFSEIVTILKHEKPMLYQQLKIRTQWHEKLRLYMEFDMDLRQAKRNLNYE